MGDAGQPFGLVKIGKSWWLLNILKQETCIKRGFIKKDKLTMIRKETVPKILQIFSTGKHIIGGLCSSNAR